MIFGFMFLYVGKAEISEDIEWGVIFSQKQSKLLGLDWKENYISLLDDYGFKNIKIITHWDLIERKNNIYSFKDLDWQIEEASKRNAKILLVVGNCEFPDWLDINDKTEYLNYLNNFILKYEDNPNIIMWELGFNDSLLGEFVKENSRKPVLGLDINSLEILRNTFWEKLLSPIFFNRISFGKEIIVSELRGQPYGNIYEMTRDEQEKSMNLNIFKNNIEFAEKTGFDTFYISGGEWWYLGDQKYWDMGIREYLQEVLTE